MNLNIILYFFAINFFQSAHKKLCLRKSAVKHLGNKSEEALELLKEIKQNYEIDRNYFEGGECCLNDRSLCLTFDPCLRTMRGENRTSILIFLYGKNIKTSKYLVFSRPEELISNQNYIVNINENPSSPNLVFVGVISLNSTRHYILRGVFEKYPTSCSFYYRLGKKLFIKFGINIFISISASILIVIFTTMFVNHLIQRDLKEIYDKTKSFYLFKEGGQYPKRKSGKFRFSESFLVETIDQI